MISIQYKCDKCGASDPYQPSKAQAITCRKCGHSEDIPSATELKDDKVVGKVICPHCKHVHENWQDFMDFESTEATFELDCDNCPRWFRVDMDMTPRFSTRPLDEDIEPV